ncbi:hypothetical protein J2T10_001996 [Paenarthrobacter nicotinovorans]|uniref:Head-to-tail stopper n=1 Tax=Paenarthrobacter nicotinovorans TaxID=29320 RepID=A0ABT9TL21_PAENI|nr:hypothetical protein [Paenarthrobacter nicotinovorans]MDQ0102350.1 hypothetical protein [Paenarthrobacter nicotinovorans]
MSIVSGFPDAWRADVVVLRGGGRDPKGNPLPATEVAVNDCIVGPRATREPADRSDIVSSTAVLYRDPDESFSFLPKDRVRVPTGALMAGEWSVDGLPGEWPLGVEVGLVRS